MELEEIREIIKNAQSVVFLGGAGVSTDSGIPDFRGNGGLYTEDTGEVSPEEILTASYMRANPQGFYEYYKGNMIYTWAQPNQAHRVLARMEKDGKLTGVITQNIDGLHQRAGSKNVIELHGTSLNNYCIGCGKTYSLDYIMECEGVPYCEDCGGLVRPDVVMYKEGLDTHSFYEAQELIYEADVLIVGGTSLKVYPAAGLIDAYQGDNLIIINKDPTGYDDRAKFVIRESISDTLSAIYPID
ncbi:MAG: NAD-dependent protein deacylase [Clostridia bacterium]|nr:NAD-dependent protein deacylase [Clostridia bacterium]